MCSGSSHPRVVQAFSFSLDTSHTDVTKVVRLSNTASASPQMSSWRQRSASTSPADCPWRLSELGDCRSAESGAAGGWQRDTGDDRRCHRKYAGCLCGCGKEKKQMSTCLCCRFAWAHNVFTHLQMHCVYMQNRLFICICMRRHRHWNVLQ